MTMWGQVRFVNPSCLEDNYPWRGIIHGIRILERRLLWPDSGKGWVDGSGGTRKRTKKWWERQKDVKGSGRGGARCEGRDSPDRPRWRPSRCSWWWRWWWPPGRRTRSPRRLSGPNSSRSSTPSRGSSSGSPNSSSGWRIYKGFYRFVMYAALSLLCRLKCRR